MRVLLTDGSGLTARQCANRLAALGHVVEVLSPDALCLCRFTRTVVRVHRVPAFGRDPFGWLEAALDVYRSGGFDALLPTQEQVAVLAVAQGPLEASGVATVVPAFASLVAVQDKISAAATLQRLSVPQPLWATTVEGWDRFPAFVKAPIGTASTAVRKVDDRDELEAAAAGRTVLIQEAFAGPLVMCQSVFDHGVLVAFHASERTAEGAGGGASHKRGVCLPEARRFLEVLGDDLAWHGGLSADVILGPDGPVVIDVNPRLVEPENAYHSGVDLVAAILDLATGRHPALQPAGASGVATHQLLLGVLGAAQHRRGRRGVARELLQNLLRKGPYRASAEELTPLAGDAISALPVVLAATATLLSPATASWFTSSSVDAYALTETAWDRIRRAGPSDGPSRR